MSTTELRALLDQVADTREHVLRAPAFDAVFDAWRDAHEEAADAYAVYRAAQDREDAAQDALTR